MSELFKFFEKANKGDFSYVDSLSDDEVKKLSPFTLTMWAHGAEKNKSNHILFTNVIYNPYVFSFYKHPRLLLKLWIAANEGSNDRYKFVKSITQEETKLLTCIAKYYQCGIREAKDIKKLLTDEDMKMIIEIYGE